MLEIPKAESLANNENGIEVSLEERHGEHFKKLKRKFLEHLALVEHPNFYQLKKKVCERLEISWRTQNNYTDCGILMMRHMETYLGSARKNWKCELKIEGPEQHNQINELRKKYILCITYARP
nr:ulp1 protease family, C-terminal catalytic domain-containing protein [Tanacetum cinerariifolium]